MILSAHQPAYMPWAPYLDRIAKSDIFVLLDLVQFERGSHVNRNKIKTQNGAHWLTVPCRLKGHMHKPIREIRIDSLRDWRRNHLKTLFHAYTKSWRCNENIDHLNALLEREEKYITDLCIRHLVEFWMPQYEITTTLAVQPAMKWEDGNDLILRLCETYKADTYLAGPLGRDYLDEQAFAERGIKVVYHEPPEFTYPQLHGEFLPGLSILDMWFNTDENPWRRDGIH